MVVASLLVAGTSAAQDVVIFKTRSIGPYDQAIDAFQAECKQKTTIFDMNGDDATELALVEQIRAVKPKVILAIGTKAAKIAKEKLPGIPVVFCMVLNPDKSGVLGPNTTGVLLQVPYSRQFSTLKTLIPTARKVGVLYNPATTEDSVELAAQEAATVGIQLLPSVVTSETEVVDALRDLLAKNIDLLWLTMDSTVLRKEAFSFIIAAMQEKSVPVMACQSIFAKDGLSMPLTPSYRGIGKQAARMANRILAGAKVSAIAVEPPDDSLQLLNWKAAPFGDVDEPPYTPLYELP